MDHANPADTLEAALVAENTALERHDATAAVALLEQKLAATQALAALAIEPQQLARLRDLAADNRRLLERAIGVQSQIINMVARAAQSTSNHSRYGADCRTVRNDGALAIARQA